MHVLIGQGEMMVDKQPGMAYALAGLALQVGAAELIACGSQSARRS